MSRRDVASVAGILAASPLGKSATAEEVESVASPVEAPKPAASASPAKFQRVMINIVNDEALKNEIKFWTEAAEMKVLKDFVGSDRNRTVILGYGSEASTAGGVFGIQLKIDPGLATRPAPRFLNYDVMQPTVDALNFVQIGARGKVIEIFNRVQSSGGSSLFGDASYIDVESPRGVPVRMVPTTGAPSVEFLSFNIEVPAFEPTVKFYQRAVGLKPVEYQEDGPPIQKLSVFLESPSGGPKVLLSPVPDGRLKDRKLDFFEGALMVSTDTKKIAEAAEAAIVLAKKEEEEKKAKDAFASKKKRTEEDRIQERATRGAPGTKARPSVAVDGTTTILDDGVGNFLFVADAAEFDAKV